MKRRVLVLTHQDFVLPDDIGKLSDKEIAPWKTEYDVVTALGELGHEARTLGAITEVATVRTMLRDWEPHIVFLWQADDGSFEIRRIDLEPRRHQMVLGPLKVLFEASRLTVSLRGHLDHVAHIDGKRWDVHQPFVDQHCPVSNDFARLLPRGRKPQPVHDIV